ncbi:MAG: hypothetical protein M1836_001251 [Candelina mexicana]|nr:MAG: hypothetical protein M1836_001251 [Candelina mexicana]
MICQRCLYRSTTRHLSLKSSVASPSSSYLSPAPQSHFRSITTTPIPSAATILTPSATQAKPRQTTPSSPNGHPSATSKSAAQPFSTPLTPSPAALGIKATKSHAPIQVVSSVVAGTPLKGLGYMKNKPDPVALGDEEYPSWLWGCLREKRDAEGGEGRGEGGDLFSKSKKQRRVAAKRLRKQALLDPESLAPKIPLQEQSIDLPYNADGSVVGALEAMGSRDELTRAMRGKRKSVIKESNYLRGMK